MMTTLLISLMAAGGCSAWRAPSVQVTGAELSDRSEASTSVAINLTLSNPNADPLRLQEVRYSVRAPGGGGGGKEFRGRRAALITIPARGEAVMMIPAVVEDFSSGDWASGLAVSGRLTYLAPGALEETLFDLGVRKPTVGFAGSAAIASPDER